MVGSGVKKVFKIYIVVDVGFLEREGRERENIILLFYYIVINEKLIMLML